jgi:MGT family glycosyltransferase
MRRHIAFVNVPTIGEIYPTLAVVAELVRRGHRVSYATAHHRAQIIESTGAALVPYSSILPDDAYPHLTQPGRMEYLGLVLSNFLTEAQAGLEQLEPWFTDDRPDVIAYSTPTVAGRALAEKLRIPAVQLWMYLGANEKWSISRHQGTLDPTQPTYQDYLAKLDVFVARHGLSWTAEDLRIPVPEQRQVMFYPKAFQYDSETFDDRYHFVGPCIGQRPFQDAWLPADPDRPLVLISLGTIYNGQPGFYRMCIDAFADSPWEVVLAVGERIDLADLGPIPDNVAVSPSVPQLDVLAHAKAFVTHAGMGGIMEALLAEVPMVTVPQTPEQEANADRLTELGLGMRLPATLTAATLRAAVEQLVGDEGVAVRLSEMHGEILASGGTILAADLIESVSTR